MSKSRAPPTPPPPGAPPSADDDRRKLIIRFGAACAALLAVLVVVVIYGVFFNMSNTINASSGPATSTSESETPTTTAGNGWGGGTQTATESPTAPSGSGPQATDGGLTFAITGVETAPSVKYQGAPPFGRCDMNSADGLTAVDYARACGIAATDSVPTEVEL